MNSKNLIKDISLVAMMSALCCAGTFIQIRMPAGDMVHLGNFVLVIAALILGGVKGGIVGSLGMGIYDLIYYTSKPSTILRTFILKFLIGFIVGSLFRLIIKKELNIKKLISITTAVFLVVFGVSLGLFIGGSFDKFSLEEGFNSYYIVNMANKDYTIKISLYIPIFAFIFFFISLFFVIFSFKLSKRTQAALFAIMIAIFVNIVGEFILRWFLEGIMVSDFNTSLAVATSKIPGSFITGFISVFLSILVYEPVYRVLSKAGLVEKDVKFSDEKNDDIQISEVEDNLSE